MLLVRPICQHSITSHTISQSYPETRASSSSHRAAPAQLQPLPAPPACPRPTCSTPPSRAPPGLVPAHAAPLVTAALEPLPASPARPLSTLLALANLLHTVRPCANQNISDNGLLWPNTYRPQYPIIFSFLILSGYISTEYWMRIRHISVTLVTYPCFIA
jgi:hypothetical protein